MTRARGGGPAAPEGAPSADDPYAPGSGAGGYRATHYDLSLDYRVESNRLDARAVLTIEADTELSRFSLDLAHGLRVSKVAVGGRRAAHYAHRGGKLHVWPAEPLRPGWSSTVEVRYAGRPGPISSPWGDVGWEELTDGVLVAGQPTGAPSWFPCNDHPSQKAPYRITVTCESEYTVVSNGRLVSRTPGSSRTTWVHDQPEPMATYLATVQIGRYSIVSDDGPPPTRAAAPPAIRRHVTHDLNRQPEMIACFEELFGPYPFGGYDVVVTEDELEIPLEAQGLSIFGANHADGHRGSERLVAHELAHQWFGNSLTAAAWQHIWLHEGFACHAEWLWSERSGGPSADDLARSAHRELAGLDQDLLLCDPGPDLMFDDRLYKRGALTLHALRTTLGDRAFFDLLRTWVSAHEHGSVTTEQFVDAAAELGSGVRDLLGRWLDHPDLPDLPRP
jgi:aminopeptidase N